VPLSRRQFLLALGGGAAVVTTAAVVTEGPRVKDKLDPPHGSVPGGATGPVVSGSFVSLARGRTVGWQVAYPPGSQPGDHLPVTLVLHGRGDDGRAAFGAQGLQHFLGAAVRGGTPPFALAAVDGGDHNYWHARADGDDPQTMLTSEFLPLLGRHGLHTDRFGITGWSMGGYGALLLATRVPTRVAAVATDAAALWQQAGDTAAGAFDNADDFARNNVFTRTATLKALPVRLSCGRSDPFAGGNHALVTALPQAEHAFPPGAHTAGCWNTMRPADMAFLGSHLAG
jgi:S-formylglutathione hydrolase FrmB